MTGLEQCSHLLLLHGINPPPDTLGAWSKIETPTATSLMWMSSLLSSLKASAKWLQSYLAEKRHPNDHNKVATFTPPAAVKASRLLTCGLCRMCCTCHSYPSDKIPTLTLTPKPLSTSPVGSNGLGFDPQPWLQSKHTGHPDFRFPWAVCCSPQTGQTLPLVDTCCESIHSHKITLANKFFPAVSWFYADLCHE